jgi:glycosyltransferase involved in cell wall biosynthesis
MKRIAVPTRPRRSPGVTVVIPCYNYGHYLAAAVDSILTQPGVDARVIIVDDASPDGSGEVARRLAARDARVRTLVHEHNRGHIRTYNDGFALVETEFVSLVSADDIVAPGALGRAVALMQRNPGVGLVYGAIATFSDDDEKLPHRDRLYHLWRIWGGEEWIDGIVRSGYNPIASPEAVLRTAAVAEAGGYNPELPHSGDLEYWLRVAARWDVGQVHGPLQAYYRVHGGNMHLNDFGTREADLRERHTAFRVLEDPAVLQHLPTGGEHLRTAEATLLAQVDELLADTGEPSTSLRELRSRLEPASHTATRNPRWEP